MVFIQLNAKDFYCWGVTNKKLIFVFILRSQISKLFLHYRKKVIKFRVFYLLFCLYLKFALKFHQVTYFYPNSEFNPINKIFTNELWVLAHI